ncbi:MAG: BamA/TamA family outer membrane protein [Akkermansiaceae bacterium]|nr:BamA/TamA family outer membrane protein [Akkermansiaceae bacterium]MCP5548942.1 BamA/TamA family outer membrane protein [Akkermansiaceae bacterium]
MKRLLVPILLVVSSAFTAAETKVRVQGTSKGEDEVLLLLGDRLEHVRTSPPDAALADDAAFLVRQMLRKDGYAQAAVTGRVAGADTIVLDVREGPRLSLGSVGVDGAPPEEAGKLAKLFSRPFEKSRPLGLREPPFRESDVDTGLSYVRQEMNAAGYWDAEAKIGKRETDPQTGAVSFEIEVHRGTQYKIGSAEMEPGETTGASIVRDHTGSFVGRVANTKNLNAMRLAVQTAAQASGYPDSEIRMSRRLTGSWFTPLFSIQLGQRVRLRNIEVDGLKVTNPDRVKNRLSDLQGDWYDEAAMSKRVRGLLATGAFSSARFDRTEVGDEEIDLTLHLTEAKPREVSIGLGADSYQGPVGRVTYANRNLFGELLGLSTGFELSGLGLLGDVRVSNPWIGGTDMSGFVRAYTLIFSREGYLKYESGFEGGLGWEPTTHYTLALTAGLSAVKVDGDGLPRSALGETTYAHARLRLDQSLDYRDSAVLPKDGWHIEAPTEIGAALAATTTSYLSGGLSGGWYQKIARKWDVGIGGEFGVLVPLGDSNDLPIDLRLFNGGARSVRSFPERELGPSVNDYPTGGEAMWNTNFELIRSVTEMVGVVAFVDAGSLGREYDELFSADLEVAAGLGLRLNLPIGPVRFDYGYNLTRDPGEPTGAFHFAIGTAY